MSAWRVILCGDKLGGPCFVLLFKKGISCLAEVMKVMGKELLERNQRKPCQDFVMMLHLQHQFDDRAIQLFNSFIMEID